MNKPPGRPDASSAPRGGESTRERPVVDSGKPPGRPETSSAPRGRHLALARLLSSAVLSQAVLSAASLGVGLLLIRHGSDAQYGAYVMAMGAVVLLVSLQGAFCNPAVASRLSRTGAAAQADGAAMVTRLHTELQVLRWRGAGLIGAVVLTLWGAQMLDGHSAAFALATLALAFAALNREYFRIVLFALRRPDDVLRSDVAQAALVIIGVLLALRSAAPALLTLVMLALAALASTVALTQALQGRADAPAPPPQPPAHQPDHPPAPSVLREIAPLALWSTAGAAIHWTFSQGYVYLVAATLDITAVAAIAATRLLMMPVNLLSTGVGSLLLPLTSGWLNSRGAPAVVRRLALLALALIGLTLAYFAVLWPARDWIFAVVLRKHPPQRDALLLLWGAVCLVMVVRDQFVPLLVAQGRFRSTSAITLTSAVCAYLASYQAMQLWGAPGALLGLLTGELASLCGTVGLVLYVSRAGFVSPAARPGAAAMTAPSVAAGVGGPVDSQRYVRPRTYVDPTSATE